MVFPCANTAKSRELDQYSSLGSSRSSQIMMKLLPLFWSLCSLGAQKDLPRATGKDLGAVNASQSSLCCAFRQDHTWSSSLKFLKSVPACVRHCFNLCITTAWGGVLIPAPWTPVLSDIWKSFPALFEDTNPGLFQGVFLLISLKQLLLRFFCCFVLVSIHLAACFYLSQLNCNFLL